jgi:hypothetical protein
VGVRVDNVIGQARQHLITKPELFFGSLAEGPLNICFGNCFIQHPLCSSRRGPGTWIGPDGRANRTLYTITLVRLRYCPETKAYMQRHQADGLSKREAIRCVKRYVARQVYRTIRADIAALKRLDGL